MKYKSTLVLLIAVVIAAIVAYSLSRKPTSEELAAQQKRILPGLKSDAIAVVEIEADGKKLVCERSSKDKTKWLITEPLKLRADRWEVEGIIDRFSEAEAATRLLTEKGKPLQLADYGLDKPRRIATFREAAPSQKTWAVLIGNEVGVGGMVFAATAEKDAVYSIEKSVADGLDVSLNLLRSKKLTDEIKTSELTGIELKAAKWHGKEGFSVVCEKKDSKWELKEPLFDLAGKEAVENLPDKINLHGASTSDFVADDPTKAAEYGLDSPLLTLTFKEGAQSSTLLFGLRKDGEAENYYAMNTAEPGIVKVPKSLLEDLFKGPQDFREKSLVSFNKNEVKSILVAVPGQSLTVERVEDRWRIAGEKAAAADGQVVKDMLEGLAEAKAEAFVADKPDKPDQYGLDDAHLLQVTLKGAMDAVLGQMQFGNDEKDGKLIYASRPGYPTVLSVNKEPFIRDLKGGRLAFLDRQILDESESEAVQLSTSFGKEKFACARADAKSDWKLREPVEGRADSEALQKALEAVSGLRAEGFAAESAEDLAPYGLKAPQGKVSITYETSQPGIAEGKEKQPPKTRVRLLLLGAERKEEPAGFFAKLEEDPRVFILGAETLETLRANMASRTICEASGIERLDFHWDGQTRSFVYDRQGKLWKDAAGAELDGQTRARVAEAASLLENFNGSAVADYVEKDPAAYGFDSPALAVEIKDRSAAGKKVVIGKDAPQGGRFAKGPVASFVLVASQNDVEKLLAVVRPPEEPKKESSGKPSGK